MATAMQKKAREASNLCTAATAYASGRVSPWIASSESDMAHKVGLWLRNTGRTAPRYIEFGRGYKVRCNDMVLSFKDSNDMPERIG